MTDRIQFKTKVHFRHGRHGRKYLESGATPVVPSSLGRVPRIARLMALALRFESLIQTGAVADQAELARLGHVTRARITQIMNLLQLAPEIQEALLFLPRVTAGSDPLCERQLRPIAALPDWRKQRRLWGQIPERGVAERHPE